MDNNRLVITKHFPNVAPGKVYAAWTDPAIIAQWYGPEGFATAEQAANHNKGWTSSFSKIEKVLAA